MGNLKQRTTRKRQKIEFRQKSGRKNDAELRQILGQVGFRADGDVGVGQRL